MKKKLNTRQNAGKNGNRNDGRRNAPIEKEENKEVEKMKKKNTHLQGCGEASFESLESP